MVKWCAPIHYLEADNVDFDDQNAYSRPDWWSPCLVIGLLLPPTIFVQVIGNRCYATFKICLSVILLGLTKKSVVKAEEGISSWLIEACLPIRLYDCIVKSYLGSHQCLDVIHGGMIVAKQLRSRRLVRQSSPTFCLKSLIELEPTNDNDCWWHRQKYFLVW